MVGFYWFLKDLMVYFLGKKISGHLLLRQGLMKIFGIGVFNSTKICKNFGFLQRIRVENLSSKNWANILKYIRKNSFFIEKDLKKKIKFSLINLLNLRNYRGMRHHKGLSVRGQRTHSNCKTQKSLFRQRLIKRFLSITSHTITLKKENFFLSFKKKKYSFFNSLWKVKETDKDFKLWYFKFKCSFEHFKVIDSWFFRFFRRVYFKKGFIKKKI